MFYARKRVLAVEQEQIEMQRLCVDKVAFWSSTCKFNNCAHSGGRAGLSDRACSAPNEMQQQHDYTDHQKDVNETA